MISDSKLLTLRQFRAENRRLHRTVEERTLDLRQAQAQLVQQEKMAVLGKLMVGIAHEMNTPIGTITSNADTLSRSLARLQDLIQSEDCPKEMRQSSVLTKVLSVLEDITRINQLACERIITIVGSLRNFTRLDATDFQTADLHEGLENTLTLVHHELKNRIQVIKKYGDIPPIRCHHNQINQIFMNMLVNCAQAITKEGTITISTYRKDNIVSIRFSDTGVGIPFENLSRIFDPGFTTKGSDVGTGLGLSICFQIAQDHGGRIDVDSKLGKGSTFTVRLPIDDKEVAKESK